MDDPKILALPSFKFADLLYPTAETTERLRESCAKFGFFTIHDHPVPASVLESATSAASNFFNLPSTVKEKFSHDHQVVVPKTCRGYNNHELLHSDDNNSRKECFDIGIEKPLSPDVIFSGPTVMPSDEVAPNFTSSLFTLQRVVLGSLVPAVGRALAGALGQDTTFFDDYLRDLMLIQRVVYYPNDSMAGRHTDICLFTLLFQDETRSDEKASLRVFTQGKWVDVPGRKGEVVVNLGDTFQYWSGGECVSTPHMVQHKGGRPRMSFPFFIYPDIKSSFVPISSTSAKRVHVKDIAARKFSNLWEKLLGSGRSMELA